MAIKGIPLPLPRLGITPAANSKLFFWQPGTTTKQNAYTDETLATPLSNPLSADSAGLFPAIYLDPALGYKVALYPSTELNDPPTGTATFTQDNVYLPAASYLWPQACQFRLTLESGVPVSTSDQSAKTTLYCTPYGGNRIDLYNSTKTAWERLTSNEMSITLVGLTAATMYDVFVYSNSGTPTLELTAWSSATVRATGYTLQDGVPVKSGTPTRRLVGSIYINATGGQSDDTLAKRYVSNLYNRKRRPLKKTTTGSWTYTTATLRQANADATNQLDVVNCIDEDMVEATVSTSAHNSTSSVMATVAVGLDSTSAAATGSVGPDENISAGGNNPLGIFARFVGHVGIGRHRLVWLERSTASGTTTWDGTGGTGTDTGLQGSHYA